eukprot:COSAG04_NODE_1212_length_7719_cov_26.278346_7_plen_38_part_00
MPVVGASCGPTPGAGAAETPAQPSSLGAALSMPLGRR